MQFGINLGLAVFSELILVFLMISVTRDNHGRTDEARQRDLFLLLLAITFVEVITDILSRLDSISVGFYDVYAAANMMLFILNPIVMVVWMMYVCEQLSVERKVKKTAQMVSGALCIVNAVISLATPFSGLIYYFDADGIYHRGPLYLITVFSMLTMAAYTEILMIKYRKNMDSRHFYAFQFFLLTPLAASFLQILVYGYAFALNATVFSELIVFVYTLNNNLDCDYLTGLYNRRKLDNYLHRKIRAADKSHSFAAILLDINNFKEINDEFGHPEGDAALVSAAGILRTVTRADTMIARYGGDEFCIVVDIDRQSDFEALLKRIKENTILYKQIGDQVIKISFSLGGEIYDPSSGMSFSEFQAHIDKAMYEDKQRTILSEKFSSTGFSEKRRKSDG